MILYLHKERIQSVRQNTSKIDKLSVQNHALKLSVGLFGSISIESQAPHSYLILSSLCFPVPPYRSLSTLIFAAKQLCTVGTNKLNRELIAPQAQLRRWLLPIETTHNITSKHIISPFSVIIFLNLNLKKAPPAQISSRLSVLARTAYRCVASNFNYGNKCHGGTDKSSVLRIGRKIY